MPHSHVVSLFPFIACSVVRPGPRPLSLKNDGVFGQAEILQHIEETPGMEIELLDRNRRNHPTPNDRRPTPTGSWSIVWGR